MNVVETISEHDMIAAFLRSEIDSERFGAELRQWVEDLGLTRAIVDRPDTTDAAQNEQRLQLLGSYRGYRQNRELFEDFPEQVTWQRVVLSREEVLQMKYIDYDYWVELSGGSRFATDAARSIHAGHVVFGVPSAGFLAIAEALRRGAVFPELILVRAGDATDLVVLEGHVRLTAYALAPEAIPSEQTAILGTSKMMTHWGLYG